MIGLLSGVLLVLAFPRANWIYLAPFALIPLFFAIANEPQAWRRFWIGYGTGVVYWAGINYWIQSTLAEHGGMDPAESWALFVLFCLAKAVQMGLFAWLAGYIRGGWWAAPALAALWTAIEWTHNYTGFAWLVLGNAAIDWPVLPRLGPWTGVWGMSFVFALVSASLTRIKSGAALFLLPLLFLLPRLPDAPVQASALAVQPNISEETTWSPESVEALDNHLAALSKTGAPVELIVWPEIPAPVYDYDVHLPAIAREAHAEFLAGVVSHTGSGAPLNSALFLSPEGAYLNKYDKVNLVPFGEFVPWPFGVVARKVSTEAGEFAPGAGPVVEGGVGAFICYESVFPNYIRKFAMAGARVLFNLSNDSWFAKSPARYQHFEIVRMRALENARWIVRVTNNGITASIDPAGKIRKEEPSWREVSDVLPFGYSSSRTLYTRWGDWFVWVCIVIAGASIGASFARYAQKE